MLIHLLSGVTHAFAKCSEAPLSILWAESRSLRNRCKWIFHQILTLRRQSKGNDEKCQRMSCELKENYWKAIKPVRRQAFFYDVIVSLGHEWTECRQLPKYNELPGTSCEQFLSAVSPYVVTHCLPCNSGLQIQKLFWISNPTTSFPAFRYMLIGSESIPS